MTSLVIADIGIFVCQNNTFFTQCRKVLVNKNEDSKSRKIFWASLMVLPGSRHCNKYNAKFSYHSSIIIVLMAVYKYT